MPDSGGDWLQAGRVGAPHGLDGSFHVTYPNAQVLAVGVTVSVAGTERRIGRLAGTDRRVILGLMGVSDRISAEAIRGADLLVRRTAAPKLEEDEWWAEDLEGCAVRDRERQVGVVRRLLGLPSCEVLEVERPGSASDLLVPLVSDAVRSVDVTAREIDVDLGFLGEA